MTNDTLLVAMEADSTERCTFGAAVSWLGMDRCMNTVTGSTFSVRELLTYVDKNVVSFAPSIRVPTSNTGFLVLRVSRELSAITDRLKEDVALALAYAEDARFDYYVVRSLSELDVLTERSVREVLAQGDEYLRPAITLNPKHPSVIALGKQRKAQMLSKEEKRNVD